LKKVYNKPLISVEILSLDQPIASTCNASKDDMEILMSFGYFSSDRSCDMYIGSGNPGEGGMIDWDRDGVADDTHGTVCYHSNITIAFTS